MKPTACFFLCLFISLTPSSCTSDKKTEKLKPPTIALNGNWQLEHAYRNDKKTTTLDGAYLQFSGDTLRTNILGSPQISKYKLSSDTLVQYDSPFGSITYEVSARSDSTMILFTNLKRYDFIFEFSKKSD